MKKLNGIFKDLKARMVFDENKEIVFTEKEIVDFCETGFVFGKYVKLNEIPLVFKNSNKVRS